MIVKPGDLPVSQVWMPTLLSLPLNNKNKQDLNVFIGAKNGLWTENLRMRLVNGTWERAIEVLEDLPPQHKNGRMTFRQVCETISESFPRDELVSAWKNTSKRPCQWAP